MTRRLFRPCKELDLRKAVRDSILGVSNGLCEHLRAFASMRALCFFLRAQAFIKFLLRAANTLEKTTGEQRALSKFSTSSSPIFLYSHIDDIDFVRVRLVV